ncbi:type IV secretory pathway TrbD component [Geodermatophilus bullaregiensis]|uniref:DUF2530 domain-containing protein n=1 Tax=Geodermatophilus bullaregiensis TaxID=1564160 RepID=UPI0019564B78|nr:DUF2530 domain-containing protein [Geodermatophilus bullaregiensis]MBM7807287.1 type IV secretory pathway TrbD component [Geodermatophilus bullaregiensis]
MPRPEPSPPKQAPPPLRVDTTRVVLTGTALWVLALVVVLLLGDRLEPVWTWTCVAGIVLPFLGLAIMRWQRQKDPSASHRSHARGGTPRRGRSGPVT